MNDPLQELIDMIDKLRDLERTIVCRPHHEQAVRAAVAGLPLLHVVVSEHVPPEMMLILNTRAVREIDYWPAGRPWWAGL